MPLQRLRSARTVDEVLVAARAYVAELSPAEVEFLPKDCRPGALDTERDVREYAHRLASHPAHGDNARLVHRMFEFFSLATRRLQEVNGSSPPTR